jgi:spermidine/putrescine-binding protein
MKPALPLQSRLITRRSLLAGVGAAAVAGRVHGSGAADKTLRLLCWRGYDNGDAIKAFVDQTGFAVHADYIGANDEIFLKLRAGGLGNYDLITPANGMIAALVADNLIQPLDDSKLTSIDQCLPQFQRPSWSSVNAKFYAAPYIWGTVPMVYASNNTKEPQGWTDLLAKDFVGKIALTNDSVSNILIWNRALGAADPAHVSTAQLNATIQILLRIKREFATLYTSDMNLIVDRLAAGKVWVSTTGWESMPTFAGYQNAGLKIARPNPGVFSFCDNFCLVRNAPNPDVAYAFIDHMRGSAAQVILMNSIKRGTVNADAVGKLEPYARGAYDYDHLDAFLARSPFYGFPPLSDAGDGVATYVEWINAWEIVTAAKLGTGEPISRPPAGTPISHGTPPSGAAQ